jgi:hypothetical protein
MRYVRTRTLHNPRNCVAHDAVVSRNPRVAVSGRPWTASHANEHDRAMVRTVTLVVVGLLGVLDSAAADAHPRCGTRERIPTFRDALPAVDVRNSAHRAAATPKLEREGFGPNHQVRSSANFSVRWRDATVSDATATSLLAELEKAWTLYVDTWGHRAPFGTDMYKLNVYLSAGETDDPAIDFDGGYADQDSQGYPYFVMSSTLIGDEDALLGVASHELYHDFQISLGGFYEESSWWYWEATAEWAAQEMRPTDATTFLAVGAYALTEELALFHFGDPFGTDEVAGVHQYGASILPKYFTDTRNDKTLVPKTWEQGQPADDAVDAFMKLIASPTEVADTFASFAAHTAYWDIPTSAQVKPMVDYYAESYPTRLRVDAKVPAEGADWQKVPDARTPRAYGYNTIEVARPANGVAQIDIEAEASSVPGELRATLVRQTPSGLVYTPVPFTGGTGSLIAPMDATDVSATLVVAAISTTRSDAAKFPYRFRVQPYVEPMPEPMPEDEEESGCCSTGGEPPGLLVLAVAALLARPRRRGDRRQT